MDGMGAELQCESPLDPAVGERHRWLAGLLAARPASWSPTSAAATPSWTAGWRAVRRWTAAARSWSVNDYAVVCRRGG